MKRVPNTFQLNSLISCTQENSVQINGKYVPARPIFAFTLRQRFRAAWLVFTGRADAVIWPGNQ